MKQTLAAVVTALSDFGNAQASILEVLKHSTSTKTADRAALDLAEKRCIHGRNTLQQALVRLGEIDG